MKLHIAKCCKILLEKIHKIICIFYMYITFEWDENKNSENVKKQNVSEKRYFCIGKTDEGILTVRFTMRGQNIRIFGAGYWRQGKKRYEEHLQ